MMYPLDTSAIAMAFARSCGGTDVFVVDVPLISHSILVELLKATLLQC